MYVLYNFFLMHGKLINLSINGVTVANYAYILIAPVNFDTLSWKILIICARSLFAVMIPYFY